MENDSLTKNFVTHVNAMFSAREQFVARFTLEVMTSKKETRSITRSQMEREENDVEIPSKVTAVNGKKLFIDQGARVGTVNRDDAVRVGEE